MTIRSDASAYYSFFDNALLPAGQCEVPQLPGTNAQWLADGVLSLSVSEQTSEQPVIVSVGVHGDETVPIRLLDAWLNDAVANGHALARPMLLVLANPVACRAGVRQVEHNLNRLFSKQAAKNTAMEPARAGQLMQVVERFAEIHPNGLHFDLHSTIRPSAKDRFALVPPACADRNQQPLQHWFGRFAVDAWVQNTSPAATFANYTATLGYLSATVEVGQVTGPQQPLDRFLPLVPALADLAAAVPGTTDRQPQRFQVVDEIIRPEGKFAVMLEDFVNFRALSAGTLVARSAGHQWCIERTGDALLFLNPDVAVGQRVALVIRPDSG